MTPVRFAAIGGVVFLAACAFAFAAGGNSAPAAGAVQIKADRISLYPTKPKERRAGRLIYRGGLVISSDDPRVGGLSDLAVSGDGTRVLMVSDASHWLRARLSYDKDSNLAEMSGAEIAPMRNLSGAVMQGKEGDAEGLTAATDDPYATVLVSFERDHRVWRYDLSKGLDAKPTPVPMGSWLDSLPNNQGLEAIALLPRDTLVAFSEHTLDVKGDIVGALEAYPMQVGYGGFGPVTVAVPEPFAVTSAAADGNGGVFILGRRFSMLGGLGMEIRHVPATEIRPNARLEGTVLVNLAGGPTNIDNMEGLAARRGADGRTYLYVLSDDNFSPLQRTVLLMFEVVQ